MNRKDIKKRPLSDTVIANLEAEPTLYREKDSQNLYLQVKPTGAKSWVMRYKKGDGKWGWHGLGSYPLVTGATARKKYQEKLSELADGAEVLTVKQLDPNAKTFQVVAMEWYNEPTIQSLADKTKTKYLGILEKHIFPTMGNKDIALISRQSWLNFFRDMQQIKNVQTGEPIIEQANRALQVCDRIYRFAVTESIAGVTGNPLDHLHERMEKHESKEMAHVSESELPTLLNAIATIPSDITRLGVQLLSHLFLRPNEVLDGKWCEIDLDNRLWEIPKERMKKRRPHIVPLSNQAVAMLTELKAITGNDEMLFPTRSINPTDRHARFRQALKRKGYDGKQTLHGFRHIASTKFNNFTDNDGKKFDERVIEFALSHKVQGVKGVYNKAEYLDDRKKLNQWYSDWLDSLQGKS